MHVVDSSSLWTYLLLVLPVHRRIFDPFWLPHQTSFRMLYPCHRRVFQCDIPTVCSVMDRQQSEQRGKFCVRRSHPLLVTGCMPAHTHTQVHYLHRRHLVRLSFPPEQAPCQIIGFHLSLQSWAPSWIGSPITICWRCSTFPFPWSHCSFHEAKRRVSCNRIADIPFFIVDCIVMSQFDKDSRDNVGQWTR